MGFKDKLLSCDEGDDANCWVYSIEAIDKQYAGIRPMSHGFPDSARWLDSPNGAFAVIADPNAFKIFEWGVFLEIVPDETEWVVALSSQGAWEVFAQFFECGLGLDTAAEGSEDDPDQGGRPRLLLSSYGGGQSGAWAGMFESSPLRGDPYPVSYNWFADSSKCLEYRNMRLLTAIADDVAIASRQSWPALNFWTAGQRLEFAEIVSSRSDIELPEEPSVLENSLAAGFDQIDKTRADCPGMRDFGSETSLWLFHAWIIWEAFMRASVSHRRAVKGWNSNPSADALIENAKILAESSGIKPMLEALEAGVPIEDIIASF